jgi:hypothetical protein
MPNLWRLIRSSLIWCGLLAVALSAAQCASDLPGARKVNRPPGLPLDVSQLNYIDLETGVEISVDKYMEANGLKHLLLMFGAHGCDQCTKKSRDLTANYLGSHSLFFGPYQSSFGLMGVTTNADGSLAKFNAMRLNDPEGAFNYVHWNDPQGATVKKFFLPEGEIFQIPFTVLISRDRILYRSLARESKSVGRILDEVRSIIDGGSIPSPTIEPSATPSTIPTATPSPSPSPSIVPGVEIEGLESWRFETPQRFRNLRVTGCGLTSETSLENVLGAADVRLIHLIPKTCGASCQANLQALRQLSGTCAEASASGTGARCSVVTLMPVSEVTGRCAEGVVHAGGSELVKAFGGHFDWDSTPVLDPRTGVPSSLPELEEPMLLGFFPNGRLVLSREGAFSADSLAKELESPLLVERPKGPDFQLLGDDKIGSFVGEISFSNLLQDADFTIVAGFDVACSSCVEELKHWSEEPTTEHPELQLFDYCKSSNGLCQILALETYPPFGQTPQQMYEEIKPQMGSLGIRVPLLVDREKVENEFSRFFEGHLSAKFPEWEGLPGTVIYDREGKIIASFKSQLPGERDMVFETMKTLRQIVRPDGR